MALNLCELESLGLGQIGTALACMVKINSLLETRIHAVKIVTFWVKGVDYHTTGQNHPNGALGFKMDAEGVTRFQSSEHVVVFCCI